MLAQPTQAGAYATGVQYFPNGAIRQFSYGNGIIHVLTQNARGLPETSVDTGGIDVLDDTYLYDRNGNVAEIIDGLPGALGDREMSYDDLDRLLTVDAGSAQGGDTIVQYDGHDNIRALDQGSRQYRHHYNSANRLSEIQDPLGTTLFTLSYDNRGNQIRRTINGLHDTYTFDKANRLTATSIREDGVPVVSSYLYDGLGRRVRETRGQATYSGYNQAGQLLHQRDLKPATDVDHTYIYLGGSLVAKRTIPVGGGTAVIEYQHSDALGSPIAVTNHDGTAVSYNRQTAYGEPADGSWESGPGFTGHVVDAGSRLVYMQQRHYDPTVGIFISTDPVGTHVVSGANFNRYDYALSNPYRFIDPDGRYVCDGSKRQCERVADYVDELKKAREKLKSGSKEHSRLTSVLARIGDEGEEGLTIRVTRMKGENGTNPRLGVIEIDDGAIRRNLGLLRHLNVGASPERMERQYGAGIIAHEVSHDLDRVSGKHHPHYFPWSRRDRIEIENRAYNTQSDVYRALGFGSDLFLPGMTGGARIIAVARAVENSVNYACSGKPSGNGTGC